MSSPSRNDPPSGKSRQRVIVPVDGPGDDVPPRAAPPSDDTPTIISRIAPAPALAADDPASIRGRRLAHFELIEPIGVGGMAAVLRARDTQLDRFVALKILPPEMAADPENVRRFHQEARSAAKLDHENVARVFYCGEDQRLHFIAFEFVEGENLRAVLERRGRLPVAEAVHYMLQVAAGLAHAARRGVVHRDIKPSNIIITPNGRAKLVDMGLARSLDRRQDDLTQSGVTLGTFDYISPEQALEPRDADVRSDIYSLGCTFYHVLTGRPPVPEGTAARKLHHHQHVKPADPRQFVPDLPLEVVQILDKMMAKNPRDRFGSPEQLVHQLLLAARQLGAAPDVPEGVLTVEAALPTPPVGRPLVWAGLAAVAVVGLVLLLDQTQHGGDAKGPPAVRPDNPDGAGKGGQPVVQRRDDKTPQAADTLPAKAVYEAPAEPTAQHLFEWLQRHQDYRHIELRLAGDLDLSSRGLLVQAKQKVEIRPSERGIRPTIRLRYEGDPAARALVALTINSPESVIEGVRFVVDVRGAGGVEMAALRLAPPAGGAARHQVLRCEFTQARPGRQLASVVVDAGRARAEVLLRDCLFLGFNELDRGEGGEETLAGAERGGQTAVVRRGAARLRVEGCAFGPHAAAFRLEGAAGPDDAALTVRHCTLLLAPRQSAAFDVAAAATVALDVAHCLIGRHGAEVEGEPAVLIRQAEAGGALSYQGRDNAYHDLDGYWVQGDDWQRAGWGDFRQKVGAAGGKDESRVLLVPPWELDPARQLEALEGGRPADAFAVKLRPAALRELGKSETRVIGVNAILAEPWLPNRLPPVDDKVDAAGRALVVEKDVADAANGVYSGLDAAVRGARPGDTILIRHRGELETDPVQLNKKSLGDLSVRAARGFRPVLALTASSEAEVAMFRVYDGRLRLKGLELRLRPPPGAREQTVVSLVGDGECVLTGCLVTLEKSGETAVALAKLVAAGAVMKSDMPLVRPRELGPKLTLDGCLIRGDGDLLATRAGRPFGLEVKDSLVALGGTLVHVDLPADAATAAAAHKVLVELSRTSTYLGGPLVRLSAGKDPRGLAPVTVKAAGCLFVPAGGKPLVLLEGPDSEERTMRDAFAWEGGKNAYGTYTAYLEQRPGGELMPPPPVTAEGWKAKSGEESSVFGVKLSAAPTAGTRLRQAKAEEFKPPRQAGDVGPNLERLPRPTP